MSISENMQTVHDVKTVMADYRAGKVDLKQLTALVAASAVISRCLTSEITAHKMVTAGDLADKTYGKRARITNRLLDANMISTTSLPDNPNIKEHLRCSEQGGKFIDRGECLDYSGNSHHLDDCQKCCHFTDTRKQMCPS